MTNDWRECLSRYLHSRQQHRDVERAENNALKWAFRLSGRMSDRRAWQISGFNLAEQRAMRARRRRREARKALIKTLMRETAITRLTVLGILWCEDIPGASNDNGRHSRRHVYWTEGSKAPANAGLWLGKYACGPARYYPAGNSP